MTGKTWELTYPLAISRLLISFFTFHTAMFLSAIDSEDMMLTVQMQRYAKKQ